MGVDRLEWPLSLIVLTVACRGPGTGEGDSLAQAERSNALPSAPSSAAGPSAALIAPIASASAPSPPSPCPPEMALVAGLRGKFCIDRWEGSILAEDGTEHSPYHAVGPRAVKAVSRSGVVPQAYISLGEADAACTRAGKRVCTTQQWIDACAGGQRHGRTFPYGVKEMPGACNTSRPIHPSSVVHGRRREDSVSLNDPRLNQQPDTVARTGEFARCVTPEGVHDLHGNLLEWTRGDKPLLMGGHYLDGNQHGPGCTYVTDAHVAQYHDFSTGFRCCQAPEPELLAAFEAVPVAAAAPSAVAPSVALDLAAPRDPDGMRSFVDATGKLPELSPPPYPSPDAACPVDMVHVDGARCAVPVQTCLRWLPRLSAGQKISCAEFKQSSECTSMRRRMSYCIDRYEFTPPGYTYPLTHVNWTEAQNLCGKMGKRLCFEDEWEFACEGPDALPYPYGYVRDGKLCNHDFAEIDLVTVTGDFVDRRVAHDALPGCASPFGVFNLVGNVDEWTTRRPAEPGRRAILRGGWWLIGRNRCRAATDNHGEIYAGMQTGFRCCRATR